MYAFAGTKKLVRLALRRDRIKLPILIALTAGLNIATLPMLQENFPTLQSRLEYEASIGSSMIGRLFGGPLDGNSLGAISMVEMSTYLMLMVAFVSGMTVVRHTRANEESGSTELLGSTQTGRAAPLTAALIVSLILNLAIMVTSGVVMTTQNLAPASGIWTMLFTMALVGLSFSAVAAVAAQLTATARSSNFLLSGTVGLSFLLRAIGDTFGSVDRPGQVLESLWPTWLSPFGWAQQILPYTAQRFELFWLFAGFVGVLVVAAYFLLYNRDIGGGIFAERTGKSSARPYLIRTSGLVWRQVRGGFIFWLAIALILGVVAGSSAEQFRELIENNESMRRVITALGGDNNVIYGYIGYITMFTCLTLVIFGLQIMQRPLQDETRRYSESLLAAPVSKVQWLKAHLGVATILILALMAAYALTLGISYILASGASWSFLSDCLKATFAYTPAVLIYLAITATLFGLVPRMTIAATWSIVTLSFLIVFVGSMLKLPEWMIDLVPFTRIPNLLVADHNLGQLVIMMVVAVVLGLIGFMSYRHRDISTA